MKKLLLLMLVLLGGVMQASAWSDMYLKNSISGWSNEGYKFTGSNDGSQDVYELTLTSDIVALANGGDIYFRPNHYSEHGQRNPSDSKNFTFKFTDNGRTQTYGPTGKGENGAFVIPHSTIKASSYKITVYYKYNDNNTFYVKVDIIDMPATVSSLGYSTFSCDRALDLSNASTGLTAYKASVNSNNLVVLTKVTGKVAAGTGLLLAGTSGTIPVVTTSEGTDISSSNLLKASLTDTEVAASNANNSGKYHYFLAAPSGANIGFYNIASTQTSGAGKAYLETTTALAPASSSARVAWIFDGETTGINAIDNEQLTIDNNAPMYNLAGQRVSKSYKGVVIVNGKKMLNK